MSQAARWLFAVKLFIAAMIAFAISVRIGLPQTYWTVVTCCVVSNPNTAGIRSKGVYRFTGTFCAAIVSLLLASLFGSVPLLMIIGGGVAGTIAFTLAYLDRTPRSYGFQLFGLTLMIVLVGSVNHPESMFATAVARLCEISLGIFVVTVVDSVVLPRSMAPTVRTRLHKWLPDMERWFADALRGDVGDAATAHDRLRILADVASLSALSGQLRYDPQVSHKDRQLFFAIQRRMLRLVPLLSAIGARVADAGDMERALAAPVLDEAADDMRRGAPPRAGFDLRLRDAVSSGNGAGPWRRLVSENLADLTHEALVTWHEVRQLDAALDGGATLDAGLERRVQEAEPLPLRPDLALAARIGLGIMLAYALLCCLWLATGWQQSTGAVLMGVVTLAFFGGADEADRAIATFGRFAALASLLAAILSYGLLPLATDFTSFAIVMGLFMLPLGAWAATNSLAILLLANALSTVNLQGHYSPHDFGTFLDATIASLVGIFVAFFSLGLVRRMGASQMLMRLTAGGRSDVIALTYRATRRDRDAYLDRALDRIGLMMARLTPADAQNWSTRLLARLRAGANIGELRAAVSQLDGDVREAAEDLLAIIRAEVSRGEPSRDMLTRIDRMMTLVWQRGGEGPLHPALRSLIGLRLALFEHAPAWSPV